MVGGGSFTTWPIDASSKTIDAIRVRHTVAEWLYYCARRQLVAADLCDNCVFDTTAASDRAI